MGPWTLRTVSRLDDIFLVEKTCVPLTEGRLPSSTFKFHGENGVFPLPLDLGLEAGSLDTLSVGVQRAEAKGAWLEPSPPTPMSPFWTHRTASHRIASRVKPSALGRGSGIDA